MFCIPSTKDDVPWKCDAKDGISPTWYVDYVPSKWYDGVCTSSDVEISTSSTWDDDMIPTLEDVVASQLSS